MPICSRKLKGKEVGHYGKVVGYCYLLTRPGLFWVTSACMVVYALELENERLKLLVLWNVFVLEAEWEDQIKSIFLVLKALHPDTTLFSCHITYFVFMLVKYSEVFCQIYQFVAINCVSFMIIHYCILSFPRFQPARISWSSARWSSTTTACSTRCSRTSSRRRAIPPVSEGMAASPSIEGSTEIRFVAWRVWALFAQTDKLWGKLGNFIVRDANQAT